MPLGVRIEEVFKWFFEVYLKDEFGAVGFSYSPPSENTTPAERCKLLAISIDGVLKQYRLFVEDGYVDRELLEIAMGRLSEREKQIMEMRFGLKGKQEYTQKQVADQLGISQSYISRLEKHIIKILRKEMTALNG